MEETKQSITSLDLHFLVRELRANLIGGIIRKVYQYGKSSSKQLLLEIFCPGKGPKLLYWDSGKAFLTEKKTPVPVEPPNFCMFLRKHLLGKKITRLQQYKFDRILEIATQDHILILEAIPPGNAILCDSSYRIIMPLEIQKWRDRIVKSKELYRHPMAFDTTAMDFDSFHGLLKSSEKELGAFLAVRLGFGPAYSKELCRREGLDTSLAANQVQLQPALRLFKLIKSVLTMEVRPAVYQDTVSPFPLESRQDRPVRQGGSLSQALDEFFSAQALQTEEKKKQEEQREEIQKTERIIETQAQAQEKFEGMSGESRGAADLINRNYHIVDSVLRGINAARESGLSWEEIKQKVMGEQTPEAEAIKEIREGDALVVLELEGKPVELDFRLGPEENTARCYEEMKLAKRKLSGVQDAMAEREEEKRGLEAQKAQEPQEPKSTMEEIAWPGKQAERQEPAPESPAVPGPDKEPPKPGLGIPESPEPLAETPPTETLPVETLVQTPQVTEKPKKHRKKWFEKFHWFLSSDGFLVIGGKDAKQNEMIISKYMNPGDLVFHADIPGASFVVIQSKGQEISNETRKEAAELAAAASRAWSRGLGNMDVFCARPEQVSKTPPSGEYLSRGSFMITGEREWFRDKELKLSIGIMIDRENREASVISGPVMPVRTHSGYFVTIRPGYKKSLELARDIKNNILIKASPEDKFLIDRVPLEDIQRLIPSGSGDIVEYGV